MVVVIVPEMVPLIKAAIYGSVILMVFALAYLLGPLLGGVDIPLGVSEKGLLIELLHRLR